MVIPPPAVLQVGLDEAALQKVRDCSTGLVCRADFVRLGQELRLLDFGGAMGEKRRPATPSRRGRRREEEQGEEEVTELLCDTVLHCTVQLVRLNLLCCCTRQSGAGQEEEGAPARPDRVEVAFTTWDRDGDGFLSWDEFQQISNNTAMSQEQALRIFQHCDTSGRGRVTLEEFRFLVNRYSIQYDSEIRSVHSFSRK